MLTIGGLNSDTSYGDFKQLIQDKKYVCISNYGNWGYPIPYFINKKTGDILLKKDISNHVIKLFETHGV